MGKQSFTALKFCQATNTEWSFISAENLRPFYQWWNSEKDLQRHSV